MTRVLITGGTGFIGAHLVRRRLARGHEVHVIARPASILTRIGADARRVTIHRLSTSDSGALRDCLAAVKPNEIFHLASQTRQPCLPDLSDAHDVAHADLDGLLKLLAAAAATRPAPDLLLRAGSLAEYGFAPEPVAETQREAPADSYAAAKAAGTHFLQMLQPRLPFPAMTARFALVYGAMQSESFFMADTMRRCVDRLPIHLRRPHDRRDLVHVDDVVAALDVLAAAPRPGDVVNIGADYAPSMLEAARLVMEVAGADPTLLSLNDSEPCDPGRHLVLCNARMRETWGWTAGVSLRSGIERTLAWMRAHAEQLT